ncbi:MAG: hypothetical protein RJB65_13 [Actinomycetota bacterium]|jgi:hypothetical protein
MILPREITFSEDAVYALTELIGIMTDQLFDGNMHGRWNSERLIDLQLRLNETFSGLSVPMGIDDAALLLDGMSFTEVMSVDLPFFPMVQWTSDFIRDEIRQHWTEAEWLDHTAKGR